MTAFAGIVVLAASIARPMRAQPAPCRLANTGWGPALSVTASPLRTRRDSTAVSRVLERLARRGVVMTNERNPSATISGMPSSWRNVDLALAALALGVSAHIRVNIDSVADDGGARRLFVSVGCTHANTIVPIGSYHLIARGVPADSIEHFRTALDVALDTVSPQLLANARIYALPGSRGRRDQMLADLRYADSIATALRLPRVESFDVALLPPGDTTLAGVGIDAWTSPISEFTGIVGPLIISSAYPNGGISRHELIHVVLSRQPMHWMLQEGLATFLAGARNKTMQELICLNPSTLRSWTPAELVRLLEGQPARPTTEGEVEILSAVLAQQVLDRSPIDWMLSRPAEWPALVERWHESLVTQTNSCPSSFRRTRG